MCRYIAREKRAHMEECVNRLHFFPNKLNTRGRGRDTSSTYLYTGDDTDGTLLWSRNTCCSLHIWVTESLAESPPVTAQAAAKICGRLICTSSLHLVVGRFLRFALGTCQDTLVLLIVLRLGHIHRILLLPNLLLHLSHWTIWPHLPWRQRLEILGLHLFEHVWVILEVEEDTEKTLLVSPPKQSIFPRRLLAFTLGLGLVQ